MKRGRKLLLFAVIRNGVGIRSPSRIYLPNFFHPVGSNLFSKIFHQMIAGTFTHKGLAKNVVAPILRGSNQSNQLHFPYFSAKIFRKSPKNV